MIIKIVYKFISLWNSFVNKGITGYDFKFAFSDIYEFLIKPLRTESKEEAEIKYLFETFYYDLSYYCPFPKIRKESSSYIDETELTDYAKILIDQLYSYLEKHKDDYYEAINLKEGKNMFLVDLENLVCIINRFFAFQLDQNDLFKEVLDIYKNLEPKSQTEKKIKQFINKYIKLLEYELQNPSSPGKNDFVDFRDKFANIAFELKKKMFETLNP